MPRPLLALHGLGKSFFGVSALAEVTLLVEAGTVLGLVRENGAGKSTLMNLIGGVHRSDRGRMELSGAAYEPQAPGDSTVPVSPSSIRNSTFSPTFRSLRTS